MLSIAGAALYLATGSVTIQFHNGSRRTDYTDTGLALGSFCIITGICMVFDAALIFYLYGRKKTVNLK